VRLIDDDGGRSAVGEIGEIVGRSPVIMQGYLNQPAKKPPTHSGMTRRQTLCARAT